MLSTFKNRLTRAAGISALASAGLLAATVAASALTVTIDNMVGEFDIDGSLTGTASTWEEYYYDTGAKDWLPRATTADALVVYRPDPDSTTDGGRSVLRWGEAYDVSIWDPATNDARRTAENAATRDWAKGQSKYIFEKEIGTVLDGEGDFTFARFIHKNRTIFADTALLRTVNFRLTFDGTIENFGETKGFSVEAIFSLIHNETDNFADPCPAGDGQPCGDEVLIGGLVVNTDAVMLGGLEHEFQILGFTENEIDTATSFFTDETLVNSAFLQGRISVSGEPPVIPLPAGVWLMLGGLGALAGLRRAKRT